MGEVERIRASFGASFGSDLGARIVGAKDRQPKKQDQSSDEHLKDDALELHEEANTSAPPLMVQTFTEGTDGLDLSA